MQILELSQSEEYGGSLVLGRVVRFHVSDAILDGSRINPDKLRAIGRMSGQEYVRTQDRFSLARPKKYAAPKIKLFRSFPYLLQGLLA